MNSYLSTAIYLKYTLVTVIVHLKYMQLTETSQERRNKWN